MYRQGDLYIPLPSRPCLGHCLSPCWPGVGDDNSSACLGPTSMQPCAGDDSNNDGLMCVAGHVPSVQMGLVSWP